MGRKRAKVNKLYFLTFFSPFDNQKAMENNLTIMIEDKKFDSKSPSFHKKLDDKAGQLVKVLLNNSHPDNIREQATAIKSWALYRNTIREDATYLIDRLLSMNDKQLAVLEKGMKIRDEHERFKQGKMTLEEVYNLPAVKHKSKT